MEKPSLFHPKPGFHLCDAYLALNEVAVFRALNIDDMNFVWHYANESSEYYEVKNLKDKLTGCIKESYPKEQFKDLLEAYMKYEWTPDVQRAILKMRTFNLDFRSRGYVMFENIFNNYDKMLAKADLLIGKLGDDNLLLDVDQAKKYADLTKIISSNIPDVIDKLENYFGIVDEPTSGPGKKQRATHGPGLIEEAMASSGTKKRKNNDPS